MSDHRFSVDVVIVGAGAAGLGAARTAQELGLTSIVFEAMDRIGGRAHTDTTSFGVPWDRGCHWLHSADVNPFRLLADEYGFRYRSASSTRLVHLRDRWATPEESSAAEAIVASSYAAAAEASAVGRDEPATAVVDAESPWLRFFRSAVAAEWGVGLDAASTVDMTAYRDTVKNWPLQDGYGALVARHAAGIDVELSTAVRLIEWDRSRPRVTTDHGTLEAGAVVVTASTSALAAGAIRFVPELPTWKQEAFVAVPLGSANKVAFGIDGRLLEVEEHTTLLAPMEDGTIVGFQLRPFGADMANGYLAGPVGAELERSGEAAMAEAMRGALRGVFGNDVIKRITTVACSTWGREPSIRGGYAAALPGQAHRRADLRRPVGERLFFAGEATSSDFFSTCHGAHLSGIATIQAVAELPAAV